MDKTLLDLALPISVAQCAQLLSHVQLFVTSWTVALQSLLSMGLSRQEYWTGLSFPPLEDLPNPRIEPATLVSPALAGQFFTAMPLGKPKSESVSHSVVSDSLWTFLCSHLQSHIPPRSVMLLTLAFPSCIALPLDSYLSSILSFRLCWKNTSFILFSQTFSLTDLSLLNSKYTFLLCFLHISVWNYLLNVLLAYYHLSFPLEPSSMMTEILTIWFIILTHCLGHYKLFATW